MSTKQSQEFLYKLLNTPSVSGYETRIQKVIKKYISDFTDDIEVDLHGNLIAGINTQAKRKVMLAGHCDQIGFMVQHIDEKGFLRVLPVGGIDFSVVPGAKATIHTKQGPVKAVFGRTAIHLVPLEQRDSMKLGAKYNWLDIGAKDGKEAKRLVEIGDPITYELGITELANNLISSPGLDDKVGCYIAIEVLKRLAKKKLNVAVYAASTIQEEVGLRGATTAAFAIDPEIGLAIDVTHGTDNPAGTGDLKQEDVKLGSGPTISRGLNTNPVVEQRLLTAAKSAKVPVQVDLYPRPAGTDASAIQVNKRGVATASIGIPCRYIHTTVEVISLKDIEYAITLLVKFISDIKPGTDFRPC